MKTWTTLFTLFASFLFTHSQESTNSQNKTDARILSYQELLDSMASCKDSVFTLENATIRFDSEKDQRFIEEDSLAITQLDTIYVNAKIRLQNIDFEERTGGLSYPPVFLKIKFEDEVSITKSKVTKQLVFFHCAFESEVRISLDKSSIDNDIVLSNCILRSYSRLELTKGRIISVECLFDPTNKKRLSHHIFRTDHEESFILFQENSFVKRDTIGQTRISGRLYSLRLWDNGFESDLNISELSIEDITMIRNTFNGLIDMTNVEFGSYKSELYYDQLGGNVGVYSNEDNAEKTWRPTSFDSFADSIAAERFFNVYRRLTEHFKSRGNTRDYNRMYIEMKDFETMQLQYYSEKEKSLAALFSWRVNQLLGVISDYGTRPTKSLIYSIYIILLFALIYVFFPNSWDTQGRKRLIDRYAFFFKYLRKEAGIHEVYLENKQEDLKQYEEFKNLITDSSQEVPKFFTRTALTIYTWGISGTNLSAKFLRQFDVVKGRWKDLPPSKRIWKSFLITGAFIVAIIYDLFIKALNALMLSVNAFTTLGFGEIPIKGVPRYLAIIEGFIGWFMLTIFSVALISQLLN